jgi:hypothetical protein
MLTSLALFVLLLSLFSLESIGQTDNEVIIDKIPEFYCLGGTQCDRYCTEERYRNGVLQPRGCIVQGELVIRLDREYFVNRITMMASDKVGDHHTGLLQVVVDHKILDEIEVNVSVLHTLHVGVVTNELIIRSLSTRGPEETDETLVWDSAVFGVPLAPDSCLGNCGGSAGQCWCDDLCEQYGDCCRDHRNQCILNTCDGNCDGPSLSGDCWCDVNCTYWGDCCNDYKELCY